ncbi:MAG: Stk1 family PASTA domain-containing Ser/Thr kinase [Bacilli bacterium]|nr:Stk1 family PASTA domain-containing Ser/Thr kinase [Bacilli bacterium]
MLSKGQKINERYEIVKSIGEGGMANVYLAEDSILDRKVAIKVLRGDLSADDKFIRRFEREAQSVSNLSHQNIVEVYDVGVEDGEHYIVMEYIEGKTLKQLLKKRESLTLTEVIDIMTQLTDGIAHAHESYIIHRDIKPQNIMIEDNGLIKITDFGIAMALNATQLTQTNSVMGSVHYLPPEQASGKGATIKSDIYSLGILMYELLTGNVPFKGDNAVEIALKHMKDKIPSIRKQNPAIPQSVENILLKAAAKNPRNRYDSAREMYEDFLHCLDEEHANDKKIFFEYPENDLDETAPIEKVKKTTKKEIEKPITEDTEELVTEITTEDSEDYFEEPKKRNTLITILASFFLLLLIAFGIFWIITTREVKDVTVPNVVGLTIDEAIQKLEEAGFTYTTEQKNSDTVGEGLVIKTTPKAGSTRKEGDTITIIESIGGTYHYLENYIGANYTEIKAKLELLGINVIIEKKDIENKDDYKGKENIIIEQKPAFDETKEKELIEKGDTITLYIPNIVDEYPDMVSEGWTLNDTIAFAKKYKLNLTVYDMNKNLIPDTEYNNLSDIKVIYQQRSAGDTIIEGIGFYIQINTQYTNTDVNQEETSE